jgi:hypothetical protein
MSTDSSTSSIAIFYASYCADDSFLLGGLEQQADKKLSVEQQAAEAATRCVTRIDSQRLKRRRCNASPAIHPHKPTNPTNLLTLKSKNPTNPTRKRLKKEDALKQRQNRKSNKGKREKEKAADIEEGAEEAVGEEMQEEVVEQPVVVVEESEEEEEDELLCPNCDAAQMPLGANTHVLCVSCHATLEVELEEDGQTQRLVAIAVKVQGGKSLSAPSKRMSHKKKKLRGPGKGNKSSTVSIANKKKKASKGQQGN